MKLRTETDRAMNWREACSRLHARSRLDVVIRAASCSASTRRSPLRCPVPRMRTHCARVSYGRIAAPCALPTDRDAPAEALALTEAVVETPQLALARPEPLSDDYGLRDIEWVCRCADCRLAIDWALSSSAQSLTLAMAESRRSHLITKSRGADAPFGFDIVRKGSPHKLVISKPADLHRRYAARRKVWAEGLAALASAFVTLTPVRKPGQEPT
jgi:hypothetical protein